MTTSDDLDDFLEYDVTMRADAVKCQHCGASVQRSLLLGCDIERPKCGENIAQE